MLAMTQLRLPVALIIAAALAALLALAAFSSEADATHSWGNTIGRARLIRSR
jgi:hypothetical protein